MPDDPYRLPRTVVPWRYDLTIEPDLKSATFSGSEAVRVGVAETVTEIVLNAVDLEIDEAWVDDGGRRIEATARVDEATERLTLELASAIEVGESTVHLRFRGVLNDKLKGFYRSTFTDDAGTEHVIGTTQMEPTDARRAFPCWDEPDMKAVFGVTLVVDDGLMAISNGAEAHTERTRNGKVAVTFAPTCPMSTYLVAFVVGPLEATAPVDVDGIALRVVHVPGKGHLTDFALDAGAFCLRWFRDYYGIDYPGDKCDLIALPDFAAGAMENLGAITFREAVLLTDPAAATQGELQRVADVVAHELAHMWFGDLVTMKWWNGLWLNEAFATFMELAAVDAYKPEWQRWVAFTNERAAAFATDSLASTRPIEYPVKSPEDAEGMFDVLTYQKGASVLRMLEQYLGTDGFRAGIRHYLETHKYSNAETTDLWDAIEHATGEPVRRIMDAWIFQGGYPLVSVDDADGTEDDDRVVLGQQRFTFLGGDPAGDATWPVPLLLGSPGTAKHRRHLLEGDDDTFEPPGRPAVVNAGGHGFYRVAYSPQLLTELRSRLDELAPVERALLLDDTWAAVLAGRSSAADYLELARAYAGETDRAVWTTLSLGLAAIERIVPDDVRPRFAAFVCNLATPALERLGWTPQEGEDELTGQLRGSLITLLGTTGQDPSVRGRAREEHRRYLEDQSSVDPNVAAAVVGVIASDGSEEDFDAFLERHLSSPSPQESLRYLYALSAFPSRDLAARLLPLTLDTIRSQNAAFTVLLSLGNRDVNDLVWEFVKTEWDALNSRLPDNAIPRMLGGITALSTKDMADDVAAFLADHPVPQGAKMVEQALERLRVNVALREREADRIGDALG